MSVDLAAGQVAEVVDARRRDDVGAVRRLVGGPRLGGHARAGDDVGLPAAAHLEPREGRDLHVARGRVHEHVRARRRLVKDRLRRVELGDLRARRPRPCARPHERARDSGRDGEAESLSCTRSLRPRRRCRPSSLRGCRARDAAAASCLAVRVELHRRIGKDRALLGSDRRAPRGRQRGHDERSEAQKKRGAAPPLAQSSGLRGHRSLFSVKSRRRGRPRRSARSCTSPRRRPTGSWPRRARGCDCAARRGTRRPRARRTCSRA